MQATGVDYNRFALLDEKLRKLVRTPDNDLSGQPKKYPPSQVVFSLTPSKSADSKTASLLTGISLRHVTVTGNATKTNTKTSYRSHVQSYAAYVQDKLQNDLSQSSYNTPISSAKPLHHLDSLGVAIDLSAADTSTDYNPFEEDPVDYEYDHNDSGSKGLPDLPDRPWEWEKDAQLLEDLARDEAFDFNGIQARALAPLESYAVLNAVVLLHEANKKASYVAPSRWTLDAIKLHRQKLLARHSSLLGVLEAGGSDNDSDADDEVNMDRPDEYD